MKVFAQIPDDTDDPLSLRPLDAQAINAFFRATLKAYSDFVATNGKTARSCVWQHLLEALWDDPRIVRRG